jgi:hypothetical protein
MRNHTQLYSCLSQLWEANCYISVGTTFVLMSVCFLGHWWSTQYKSSRASNKSIFIYEICHLQYAVSLLLSTKLCGMTCSCWARVDIRVLLHRRDSTCMVNYLYLFIVRFPTHYPLPCLTMPCSLNYPCDLYTSCCASPQQYAAGNVSTVRSQFNLCHPAFKSQCSHWWWGLF